MTAKYISPSRVGRYFHLECERYLRYSSTPSSALVHEGVPRTPWETRPVNRAVLDTGYQWEERALAGPLAAVAVVAPAPPDRPNADSGRIRSTVSDQSDQLFRSFRSPR